MVERLIVRTTGELKVRIEPIEDGVTLEQLMPNVRAAMKDQIDNIPNDMFHAMIYRSWNNDSISLERTPPDKPLREIIEEYDRD